MRRKIARASQNNACIILHDFARSQNTYLPRKYRVPMAWYLMAWGGCTNDNRGWWRGRGRFTLDWDRRRPLGFHRCALTHYFASILCGLGICAPLYSPGNHCSLVYHAHGIPCTWYSMYMVYKVHGIPYTLYHGHGIPRQLYFQRTCPGGNFQLKCLFTTYFPTAIYI